jgi:hypothetical protein
VASKVFMCCSSSLVALPARVIRRPIMR